MGLRVIKPLLLGFLCRSYHRQGHRLALSGLVGFSFSDPDLPVSEQALWQSITPFLPADGVWDEGIPKDRGEVLLAARCHGPGGQAVSSRRVVVRVGPVAKALDVHGDRVWVRERGILRIGDPVPFTAMSIEWSRAYGGPGYAANPVGKGFPGEPPADPLPLPNIENPAHPLLSPDDRPAPAGLGALGLSWSGRSGRIGRYRAGEIGREPPELPADSDWTLYNQAPPDQWLPGSFAGGEPFFLEGLHPEKDRLEGRLPRIVLRAFATLREGDAIEVPLAPETLWLFPDLEMGVMIHRGSLPVASDDASEVASVLLAAEDPGEARPPEHYLSVRNRRAGRDPKDRSRFSDVPLLPARLADDPRARLLDVDYHLASTPSTAGEKIGKILEHKRETIDRALAAIPETGAGGAPPEAQETFRKALEAKKAEVGKALDAVRNQPPKSLLDLVNEGRELQSAVGDPAAFVETKLREALARIPPEVLEKAKMDRESLLRTLIRKPEAPPKPRGTPGTERLEALRGKIEGLLTETVARTPQGLPPEKQQAFGEALSRIDRAREKMESSGIGGKMSDSLVRTLHHFRPPDADPERARAGRERVTAGLRGDRRFRGQTLRGADLSGLDLSGCDFSECDLLGADLSGSDLSGARFSGAWMAHGRLSGAHIERADFSGAGLGCADLTGVRGTGANFEKAVLSGAVLDGCVLSEGRFSGAELFQVQYHRATLRKSSFPGAKFMRAGRLPYPASGSDPDSGERLLFREADFSGSDFTRALFMKADFERCDFSEADLSGVTFLECAGPETRFTGAVLRKASFPNSVDFSRSCFKGADLALANLRGLDLSGADFRGATLAGTDLSGGNLSGSRLSGVRAVGARFVKADLRGSDGRGGDFRQGLFLKADLRFADFSHGSLYAAGFTGAKIDDSTRWDNALTGKTVLSGDRPS